MLSRARTSVLAFALLLALPARAAQPAFELTPLGVLGGDDDTNLSSYALGIPGKPASLLIDAGAFTEGVALWKHAGTSPSARAKALTELFGQLDAVLITHAHLDHVSGLLLTSPMILGAHRKTPLPIAGLPQTLEGLHAHALSAPLWVDFTKIPSNEPALALLPIEPGAAKEFGAFRIETVPLVHPVPSAAFIVTRGDASYLHLGDTGPTEEVWKRGKVLLDAGHLRAISVEVSFPDGQEALAVQTGHLTPSLLVKELGKLAGSDSVEGIAKALRGTTIIAIHIKGSGYETVVRELSALQKTGLAIVIPARATPIRF
jgi:cAMP phosphodiesterase